MVIWYYMGYFGLILKAVYRFWAQGIWSSKIKAIKKGKLWTNTLSLLHRIHQKFRISFSSYQNTIKITVELKSSFFSCFKLENVQRALELNAPVRRIFVRLYIEIFLFFKKKNPHRGEKRTDDQLVDFRKYFFKKGHPDYLWKALEKTSIICSIF